MFHAIVALSILSGSSFVNAAAKSKPAAAANLFSRLVADVQREGQPDQPVNPNLAAHLGVHPTDPFRTQDVTTNGSSDGLDHERGFAVHEDKPEMAYFSTQQTLGRTLRCRYYLIAPSGKLWKVLALDIDLDSQGDVVDGSGRFSDLDPKARDVQAAYQHELDFWLKGKYRKAAGGGH